MAEGLLRHLYPDLYDVYSSGTYKAEVHPYAIQALKEINIDISSQKSETTEEYRGMEFDIVVTVCDHAKESCPFFPKAKKMIHKGFKNPASFCVDSSDMLDGFRKVRDEIKSWLEKEFRISTVY